MPTFQSWRADPLPQFGRPRCPTCGEFMWLSHVEPDKPGHDLRIFDCTFCGQVERIVMPIGGKE